MTRSLSDYLIESADIIRSTASYISAHKMQQAVDACVDALLSRKPMLVCGNGGSAADAMHIAGELVARFLEDRTGYNCLCLSDNPAMMTAWSNDHSFDTVFSRQVETYGREGGVLLAISTSGNSRNILAAVESARKLNMVVIGMTGEGGGKMAALCDVLIDAPCKHTPQIQQVHACLYHYLCERIEARMVEAQGTVDLPWARAK